MKKHSFSCSFCYQGAGQEVRYAKELYDYDVEACLTKLGIELQEPQLPKDISLLLSDTPCEIGMIMGVQK